MRSREKDRRLPSVVSSIVQAIGTLHHHQGCLSRQPPRFPCVCSWLPLALLSGPLPARSPSRVGVAALGVAPVPQAEPAREAVAAAVPPVPSPRPASPLE